MDDCPAAAIVNSSRNPRVYCATRSAYRDLAGDVSADVPMNEFG